MNTNFDRLSAEEPDFSDADTAVDETTRESIRLPILANETKPLVTMVHRLRDLHPSEYPDVENIRVGSLVYFAAKEQGYRVGIIQ